MMDHRNQIYDQWLVTRCQNNEVAAFEELMGHWQERLWRHALRLTGDAEAAWDILQDSMIAITRRIGQLADPAAFPGWAYRIATNQSLDFLRRKRRRRVSMEAYLEQAVPIEYRDYGALLDLRAALAQLPAHQQSLLSLHYEEGFSVTEIAGILGVREGTVKSRLYAARQQVRTLLEETEP